MSRPCTSMAECLLGFVTVPTKARLTFNIFSVSNDTEKNSTRVKLNWGKDGSYLSKAYLIKAKTVTSRGKKMMAENRAQHFLLLLVLCGNVSSAIKKIKGARFMDRI